jgi:hypothetical protein
MVKFKLASISEHARKGGYVMSSQVCSDWMGQWKGTRRHYDDPLPISPKEGIEGPKSQRL